MNQSPPRPNGIGVSVKRVEDLRLTRGRGLYASDVKLDSMAYAAFLRSPHPHARIVEIDTSIAASMPNVLGVLTGADAINDGMKPIPHNPDWQGPPDAELRLPLGFDVFTSENMPMPPIIVRYVGEPIAMAVAKTAAEAQDAIEAIEVTFEVLPAYTDSKESTAPGAYEIWPGCAGNIALQAEVGSAADASDAFNKAAHVVRLETWINRINGVPMEPRTVVGDYSQTEDSYTLYAASGRGAVQTRERLATVLGVPLTKCRAVFGDMGGNFGTRNAFSPEFALIPWAARRVGCPVKWVGTRSECFLSDYQGRDLRSTAELALSADGKFLGLRGHNTMNLGAYSVYFWPLRKGLSMMQGVYNIPAIHFRGEAVFTNLPPTAVYRSAGRPEAIFIVERLIDMAAEEMDIDPVELRSRNLIQPQSMPFTTPVGVTYDSGDYPAAMNEVLEAANWKTFPERRAQSETLGKKRGIAIANYIEVTSGIPRERVELRVTHDGMVEFVVGTMSSGQSHETTFPQVASEWLGVPFDKIRFIANDTARVSVGGGSHSGRSMRLVTIALNQAIEALIARGKAIFAHITNLPDNEISYEEGSFVGPNGQSMDLWQVRDAAETLNSLPSNLKGHFEGIGDIVNRVGGYPYGSHVCEVEVDPETGVVEILKWTGVDDVGNAINPMVLHGQAHGAIAQGLGQALFEHCKYDDQTGQLLAGSFMDYAVPRADVTPPMRTLISEIPASSHPFGIRPGGEGGTTPALAVVISAIVNALRDYGIKHIEMPATPERVWQAIKHASESDQKTI